MPRSNSLKNVDYCLIRCLKSKVFICLLWTVAGIIKIKIRIIKYSGTPRKHGELTEDPGMTSLHSKATIMTQMLLVKKSIYFRSQTMRMWIGLIFKHRLRDLRQPNAFLQQWGHVQGLHNSVVLSSDTRDSCFCYWKFHG